MIRIRDTRYPSTAALLADAIGIAQYYGFKPVEEIPRGNIPPGTAAKKKPPTTSEVEEEISFARRDERSLPSVARKFSSMYREPLETTLAWRLVSPQTGTPSISLELHCVGHNSAMAEALLVVVANAIAERVGLAERMLQINNLGSAESSARFMRDVSAYLRKHIESISPTLRPRAAQDPLGTLIQLIERGHPAVPRAPQAMEYLTEDERRRFWEFLEYLEVFGLPYELSGQVLGSRDFWSHALYEISAIDPETKTRLPVAFGGRYDPLISRFSRKPESAAMIGISIEVRGGTRPKKSEPQNPGIFFAHLGTEARRRSLSILEQLRRAEIPVHQNLTAERLGDQMAIARKLAVPYILIMGHKEAMENAILVREVATNSQDTVPLVELSNYLKRRRLGNKTEVHA